MWYSSEYVPPMWYSALVVITGCVMLSFLVMYLMGNFECYKLVRVYLVGQLIFCILSTVAALTTLAVETPPPVNPR